MTLFFLLQFIMGLVVFTLIHHLTRPETRRAQPTRDQPTVDMRSTQDASGPKAQRPEVKKSSLPSKGQKMPAQASEQTRPQPSSTSTCGTSGKTPSPSTDEKKPEPANPQPSQPIPSPSTPNPPPKPQQAVVKPHPYTSVKVLFLTWSNERDLPLPTNSQLNTLRSILGLRYNFTIYEFSIPATGPQADQPDAALLKFLLHKRLVTSSTENELLLVIYSGRSATLNGRYHLVTELEISRAMYDDPSLASSAWRKMSWEWFEQRISSAGYDSLVILNTSYVPIEPMTLSPVRGSNMVLAAGGPETRFCAEVLAQTVKEREAHDKNRLGWVIPWSGGFLGTIIETLQEGVKDGSLKVPVDELYKKLVLEHDLLHFGRRDRNEVVSKRPYLGHIKGKEGQHEDRVIEIGLQNVAGGSSKEKDESPTKDSDGDEDWEDWAVC